MLGEIIIAGAITLVGAVIGKVVAAQQQAQRDEKRAATYLNHIQDTGRDYRGRMQATSDAFLNRIRETTRR